MKINGIPVRKDLALPSDKVRNSDDTENCQETRTDPELAMSVQVQHIAMKPGSHGAGILRNHHREDRPAEREQAEDQTHTPRSVTFFRIIEVITPTDHSATRLLDHYDIKNESLRVL